MNCEKCEFYIYSSDLNKEFCRGYEPPQEIADSDDNILTTNLCPKLSSSKSYCPNCGHPMSEHLKGQRDDLRIILCCHHKENGTLSCMCVQSYKPQSEQMPLREKFKRILITHSFRLQGGLTGDCIDSLESVSTAWHNSQCKSCIGSTITAIEPLEKHDSATRKELLLDLIKQLTGKPISEKPELIEDTFAAGAFWQNEMNISHLRGMTEQINP